MSLQLFGRAVFFEDARPLRVGAGCAFPGVFAAFFVLHKAFAFEV